jgi:hypothetical protein
MKQAIVDWYNVHIVRGYYKAWSFIVSAAAFLLTNLPDFVNLIIASINDAASAFPTLDVQTKFYILAAANVLAILLRPVKQAALTEDKP